MTATRYNLAAADLRTIAAYWGDLRDMLDTPTITTWPPSGLANYLGSLDEDALAQHRAEQQAEHAERTATAMGERPVPLRLAVLDTIETLNADLLHLADQIADSIQRPAPVIPKSAGPADSAGRALRLLAARDEAHPARWHYRGATAADNSRPHSRATRTGPDAIIWLLARIAGEEGPFEQLLPRHLDQIAAVAGQGRARVEKTLALGRRTDPVPLPCPCGGQLVLHHGGVLDVEGARLSTWGSVLEPEAECITGCRAKWRGPMLALLLAALVQQDEAA